MLGCGNSRSDGQVVRQSLSNTSRSRCVAHFGPTTPRILRSLGRSDITAAPCRVLFAAIWTDLGLGVGLGGLPCGASDIQMTPITCLHLPLPPRGLYISNKIKLYPLQLDFGTGGSAKGSVISTQMDIIIDPFSVIVRDWETKVGWGCGYWFFDSPRRLFISIRSIIIYFLCRVVPRGIWWP